MSWEEQALERFTHVERSEIWLKTEFGPSLHNSHGRKFGEKIGKSTTTDKVPFRISLPG